MVRTFPDAVSDPVFLVFFALISLSLSFPRHLPMYAVASYTFGQNVFILKYLLQSTSSVSAYSGVSAVASFVGSTLFVYHFPEGGWLKGRQLRLDYARLEHDQKVAALEEAELQMAQARLTNWRRRS